MLLGWSADAPAPAQQGMLAFPARPKPPPRAERSGAQDQMLVRAEEINYDYTNERVSAVGNVQIYFGASTIEADRVVYDQKSKRLRAEGNVRLTQADGTVTHGEIMDLSDDYRDGFVDSLRIDAPEQTRFAASRAERSGGNFTVFHNGVYTACEACKDDPKKPPKWQVKALRMVHDQGEKMIYFEDARLELLGVPIAYLPYFSAPDPTVKRKSGVLIPTFSTSTVYGGAVTIPYYFALSPTYDFTFSPMITTRQGPLLQGEWRQRLLDGSYSIRASGLFQLDKDVFIKNGVATPGYRDWRGSLQSSGEFNLSEKWVWGWDGTLLSDKTYLQDYGLYKSVQTSNLLKTTPDYALSQLYLAGRGDRSYFDVRTLYFFGFSQSDDQKQLPIVHPVLDNQYVFKSPIFGGELGFYSNFTSLSRDTANFDPINTTAAANSWCSPNTADPAVKNGTNCLLRGVPGNYTRMSAEATWKRTIIDPIGQMFTPFITMRGDVANMTITDQPGVSNYINVGETDIGRVMPTAGLEYRYPLISVASWGTQTIEPIAQMILRPNETGVGSFPNEDAQSLIYDDSNLFKVNKFSGWDRVEGGGRANVGVQYTAQFNRGGNVNVLFGQSYQLYGQNSFALGGTTNTGLASGLDTNRSDYVARASYQPNSTLAFTSRFRMNETDFTLQRTELETTANFGRWTTSVMYGSYAAQPQIGFPDRREGILGNARFKVTPNWVLLGAARYDLRAHELSQTQIGVGYVDDCLILALNYITDYAYSGSVSVNHTFMMQLSLRTLGGNTSGQSASALNTGASGVTGLR
ncbi:MAG: LPS-assembly protein LptD [Hyphomicrobiales bacterium]|nr:LPS-assembly protein LptD [Hyphomicrobiales bacterium]